MTRLLAYALAVVTLLGGAGVGIQTLRLANCQRETAMMGQAWAEAASAAIGETLAREREQSRASEAAADDMRAQADAVVPEMQQTTATAAERVRTVIRRIEVSADCPVTLPPEVVAEGQTAVERARRAGQ